LVLTKKNIPAQYKQPAKLITTFWNSQKQAHEPMKGTIQNLPQIGFIRHPEEIYN
jgi:hypothetical protein